MLTDENRKRKIERFLLGAMSAEEVREFTGLLGHDSELRAQLDAASGIEGLLHSGGNGVETDFRFTETLDDVLGHPVRKTVRFSWVHLYALAASLVLVCLGGYHWLANGTRADKLTALKYHENAAVTPVVACNNKALRRLTAQALFLSEEGSKVKVVDGVDSTVTVVVSQGNVCFEVGRDGARQITVATPHAAIVLDGTVARVVVTELETEIAVLEGSAEVIHRYHREIARPLAAGSTVFADYYEVNVAPVVAPEVCESRIVMFRKYISWVQNQVHG